MFSSTAVLHYLLVWNWGIHPCITNNIAINWFAWRNNPFFYDGTCWWFNDKIFSALASNHSCHMRQMRFLIGLLNPTSTDWQKEVYPTGICWTSLPSFWSHLPHLWAYVSNTNQDITIGCTFEGVVWAYGCKTWFTQSNITSLSIHALSWRA